MLGVTFSIAVLSPFLVSEECTTSAISCLHEVLHTDTFSLIIYYSLILLRTEWLLKF